MAASWGPLRGPDLAVIGTSAIDAGLRRAKVEAIEAGGLCEAEEG